MGFGFNLFVVFILFPLSIILPIVWLLTKRRLFGKILLFIWIPILSLIIITSIVHFFIDKKSIKRQDIYGEYIIDRTKFPGKQADWQYNHFRFKITKESKFIFYTIDNNKIVKADSGKVVFVDSYSQPRIIVQVEKPRQQIIEDEPTLYRSVWSFYYVFYSPKFKNVFFTKGTWKPLDK